MQCCPTCFGDREIRDKFIPTFSRTLGTCSYCGTSNEKLVDPSELRDQFDLLVSIYQEDESGKTLVEWFKEDWGMFSHPRMDHANACMLVADILDDGEIIRKKFSPSDLCSSNRLNLWSDFKFELMYSNRFFPSNKIEEDFLRNLIHNLRIVPSEIAKTWYRSRVHRGENSFSGAQMGPPPKERASQGRANPAGIPYLYLASNADTAVSEIRPHTGEVASVAEFTIDDSLMVIDLRNPRESISPFTFEEVKKIASMRGDIEFLVQLGNELTRPVLPHVAAIEYLPSQYLCEFIKKCTYHGVMYRSSVGDGVNLALFDPARAHVGKVEQYRVAKVAVEIQK